MAQKRIATISVLLTGIASLTVSVSFAQGNSSMPQRIRDSLKAVYLEKAAIKNPIIRQASISGEYISSMNVKTNLYGKEFYKGDVQVLRSRANLTIPIVGWGNNKVSASGAFLNQQMYLSNASVALNDKEMPKRDTTFSKSTMLLSIRYSGRHTILKLPIVYGAGIAGLIDQETGKNYLTYTGFITIPMVYNKNTSLMVGLAFNKDPYSLIPVVPLISYTHMFSSLGMEVFVEIPRRIALQKELTNRSWLTLGTELGVNPLFFSLRSDLLPRNAICKSFEIKSGLTYEYRLSKKAIIGINGGAFMLVTSKLIKSNRVNSTITSNSNSSTVPYVNLSLSFLPFW